VKSLRDCDAAAVQTNATEAIVKKRSGKVRPEKAIRTSTATPSVFLEDRAKSLLIKPEPESMFRRKLSNLFLAVFLVYRPDASQFFLINGVMPPCAAC
jgi:hypothetical protein